MEPKKKRRRPSRKKKQKRAAICLALAFVLVLLVGACIISRILDGAGAIPPPLPKNPYAPEDFTIQNGYVTCTAGRTRLGLDVSSHQGTINWETVREAGFDFAFIRIGYRGYTVGGIQEDTQARENLTAARAAGLDVGVYFYAQAVSVEEAAEEARWCLEFLEGENLDLPVVYDWEWVSTDARTGAMDKATLTACAKTFCETVEGSGYKSMIYFNSHIARDLLDLEQLAEHSFWLAQYKDQLDFPHRVDFWQYTEEGTVPGIEGNVDIDLMFLYE